MRMACISCWPIIEKSYAATPFRARNFLEIRARGEEHFSFPVTIKGSGTLVHS